MTALKIYFTSPVFKLDDEGATFEANRKVAEFIREQRALGVHFSAPRIVADANFVEFKRIIVTGKKRV